MFKKQIGKPSNKVKNVVERGAVRRFAEAIGDPHPLFINEDFGSCLIYQANIAPPTFPQVFDYGVIEGFDISTEGFIHGEQSFHYERPLIIGEAVYCYSIIKKYTEKKSSKGAMGFLVLENYGDDAAGNPIFTSRMTIIITEEVRKAMNDETT